jgi:tellurite resistance protein TehA-like permease
MKHFLEFVLIYHGLGIWVFFILFVLVLAEAEKNEGSFDRDEEMV